MDSPAMDKEREADQFSADLLIHPDDWLTFTEASNYKSGDVNTFAQHIGIAPGIVVGRLQKEERIPYSHLNGLKVKYQWNAD